MAFFFCLLLSFLSMAFLGMEAQDCEGAVQWKQRFVLDVAASYPIHNFSSDSRHECLRACSRMAGCEMFGYQPGGQNCLLYGRVVYNTTGGVAANETRYWSPDSRVYRRICNVCYKWETTGKNWTAAQDHCRREGGDLLVADSAEKLSVLQKDRVSFGWIGATLDAGTWRWLNGNPVMQNISSGCIMNGSCLFVDYDRQVSCNCSYLLPFYCELPL